MKWRKGWFQEDDQDIIKFLRREGRKPLFHSRRLAYQSSLL